MPDFTPIVVSNQVNDLVPLEYSEPVSGMKLGLCEICKKVEDKILGDTNRLVFIKDFGICDIINWWSQQGCSTYYIVRNASMKTKEVSLCQLGVPTDSHEVETFYKIRQPYIDTYMSNELKSTNWTEFKYMKQPISFSSFPNYRGCYDPTPYFHKLGIVIHLVNHKEFPLVQIVEVNLPCVTTRDRWEEENSIYVGARCLRTGKKIPQGTVERHGHYRRLLKFSVEDETIMNNLERF